MRRSSCGTRDCTGARVERTLTLGRPSAARDVTPDDEPSAPDIGGANEPNDLLARSRAARRAWFALGCLCVSVGAVGVVVPGLPTTPFLVLAAACFVRGSPTAYRKLLGHPRFGPLIRNFRAGRGVPRKVKYTAFAVMGVFVAFAMGPGLPDDSVVLRVVVGIAALVGFAYLLSLPNTEDVPPSG
jgi:hypothetical protein